MIVRPATCDDSAAIAALHAASWRTAYRNILSNDYLDHHVVDDRQDLWAARFSKFDAAKHLVCVAEDAPGNDAGDLGHGAEPCAQSEIAGFVCVLLDEEPELGALLDNLHVTSTRHGQGIGRQLIATAAAWIATREPEWAMHLWVYQANVKTVGFYQTLGGIEVEHRTIVTPAGNRAPVLRFEWKRPIALAERLGTAISSR